MQKPVIAPGPLVRRLSIALAAIAVLLAVIYIAARIPRTLTIFVIAAFIAFGVHPITTRLERRMQRPLAIASVYMVLLALMIVFALMVVPATVAQIQILVVNAPDYINGIQALALRVEEWLHGHFGKAMLPPGFGDFQSYVGSRIGALLSLIVSSIGEIVVQTFTALFVGISALILSFFFLSRSEAVGESFYLLFPASRRGAARDLASELTRIFGGFVAGQFVLSALTGIAIWAILSLFGFKFALLLGIISGFAYAVPFVGMLFAHAVGAVMAVPQGWPMVGWVTLVLFTVARISDNVLVPKIMSESVGVSPIGVMFAVFAGGELFGLPGLLLGIPAAALVKVLWKFFVAPYVLRAQNGDPPPTSRSAR